MSSKFTAMYVETINSTEDDHVEITYPPKPQNNKNISKTSQQDHPSASLRQSLNDDDPEEMDEYFNNLNKQNSKEFKKSIKKQKNNDLNQMSMFKQFIHNKCFTHEESQYSKTRSSK